MGKRLTPVDIFYIDQHKDSLTVEAIAKRIGCTVRTVYNHLNKNKGEQRTEQGREAVKTESAPAPASAPTEAVHKPLPAQQVMSMDLLGRRKHGESAAIVMTKEASELGDEIMKQGPSIIPPHVHIMNKDKSD